MKKIYIKTGFIFIFLFLLIGYILSCIYVNMIMRDSIISRVQRQFYQYPYRVRNLILGDSHSEAALNPALIKGAFNYSSAWGNYFDIFTCLKFVLDHRIKNVDTVILPLEYHSFDGARIAENRNAWYWAGYLDPGDIGWDYKKLFIFAQRYLSGRFFSYMGEKDSVFYFLRKKPLREINLGYYPWWEFSIHQLKPEEALPRVLQRHFKDNYAVNDILAEYFFRTIDMCLKNNVRVVLVRYPISRLYDKVVHQLYSLKEFDRLIDHVRQKYPDIRILDARSLYSSQEEQLFYDFDHLNEKGAYEFSRYMNDYLN